MKDFFSKCDQIRIYSKLTIKTPGRRQWRCTGVFIVDFEHMRISSHLLKKSLPGNLIFLFSVFYLQRTFTINFPGLFQSFYIAMGASAMKYK